MSGLMDKISGAASNKMEQNAQPGDGVERSADSGVNDKIDGIADDVGVPQGDDKMINEVADDKVNSDIPFGNN